MPCLRARPLSFFRVGPALAGALILTACGAPPPVVLAPPPPVAAGADPLDPARLDAETRALLEAGEQLAREGALPAAVARFDAATARAPAQPLPWWVAARAHLRLGDWAKARTFAERAMATGADGPDTAAVLAQALVAQGEVVAARAVWEQCTGRHATAPAAWRGLAALAAMTDDAETAERALTRVVALEPDDGLSWYRLGTLRQSLGRNGDAAEAYDQAATLEPPRRDLEPRIIALALDAGDRDLARKSARRVAGSGAPDGEAELAVASLLIKRDDLLGAANELETLLERQPKAEQARLMLAQINARVGRHAEANALLARIVEGSPLYADALRLKGLLALEDNALAAGTTALAAATTADPNRADLQMDYARALQRNSQPHEARGVLADAVARWPHDPDLRFAEAMLLADLGDDAGAQVGMEAVLRLVPRHPGALNFLGFTWADRNEKLSEAEAFIRVALEGRPDDPAILDSLGWVLYRQGRFAEAEAILRRAVELVETESEIHFHLAAVLHAAGRGSEALKSLATALQHAPDEKARRKWSRRWRALPAPGRP